MEDRDCLKPRASHSGDTQRETSTVGGSHAEDVSLPQSREVSLSPARDVHGTTVSDKPSGASQGRDRTCSSQGRLLAPLSRAL